MQHTSLNDSSHGIYKRYREPLVPPSELVFKASGDQLTQIEQLANKLEPNLYKAILLGLTTTADSIDLNMLINALESGDVGKVLGLLTLDKAADAFAALQPAVQTGVYSAGAYAATQIVQASGATFSFGQLNPRLISWLQAYSFNLIQQINDQTREAVRQYLVQGMTAGKNPKDVAREVKQIIGLTEKQAKAVQNYRKELETFHLKRTAGSYGLGNKVNRVNTTQVTILDGDGLNTDGINARRLRDFRYDGQLKTAMTSGKPLKAEQIDKMVAAYQRKFLAYRSRTIARTEALRTTNMGIQDGWRQAIEAGKVPEDLVRKQFIVARDERLCEVCSPVPKLNPKQGVKIGAPFNTPKGPYNLPPLHPNCRCTVFMRLFEPAQLKP